MKSYVITCHVCGWGVGQPDDGTPKNEAEGRLRRALARRCGHAHNPSIAPLAVREEPRRAT